MDKPAIEETIEQEIKKSISNIRVPNIAVIGRTGVGKSTLINAVFGIEVARTGAGFAVTQDFDRYPPEGSDEIYPIIIYDSAGYESGKDQEFVKKVFDFLEQKQAKDIEDQIHIVWYVLNAASARVEYFDRDIINKINELNIPAILVLSQCDRATEKEIKGIEEALDSFQLKKILSRIQVSASPLKIRGKPICEPFGLTELVNQTIEQLPEIYTEAVIRAQIVDLKAKRELSWQYILTAASAAFAVGFIPIPITSPLTLITSQAALWVAIASIYGYKKIGKNLGISFGAKRSLLNILSLASLDLIRMFVPLIGAVSGAATATYIVLFGSVYASAFEKLSKAHLDGSETEAVIKFLREAIKEEFVKYSDVNIHAPHSREKIKDIFFERDR